MGQSQSVLGKSHFEEGWLLGFFLQFLTAHSPSPNVSEHSFIFIQQGQILLPPTSPGFLLLGVYWSLTEVLL